MSESIDEMINYITTNERKILHFSIFYRWTATKMLWMWLKS